MHVVEHIQSIAVALRCSEPKQPPRLGKVYWPAFALEVHVAEVILRIGVALRCSKPKEPPRLGKVCRPAFAAAVHAAEQTLRLGVTLLCSKHELAPPSDLAILTRVAHGVPDEHRERRVRRAVALDLRG